MVFKFLKRIFSKKKKRKEIQKERVERLKEMEAKTKLFSSAFRNINFKDVEKLLMQNPKIAIINLYVSLFPQIRKNKDITTAMHIVKGFVRSIFYAYKCRTIEEFENFLRVFENRAIRGSFFEYHGEALALEFLNMHKKEFAEIIKAKASKAETVAISKNDITRVVDVFGTQALHITQRLEVNKMKALWEAARAIAAGKLEEIRVSREVWELLQKDAEFRKQAKKLAELIKKENLKS